MVDIKVILDKVKEYNQNGDLDLIRKAYKFSSRHHKRQVRRSGEPYVNHPMEVAYILSNDLRLDVTSIVVGLLHDTVEDTDCSISDINAHFGDDVATLVDGLTKISKIKFKTREEKQAENFRRMLIHMARDIRVILIKLADRLHNMRTLEYMDAEKRLEIAQETLDIYATIANRLGIGWMKSELEDLCLKYIEPDIYHDLITKVAKRKSERQAFIKKLEKHVGEVISKHNIPFSIYGRSKHYYSIYMKMKRQGISFEDIYDLTALRLITDSVMNCYALLGILHSQWPPIPGRFKDFIGVPKSNSYQSIHTTVIGLGGEQVEFQIRTLEMNKIAEEGIAAHWKYKENGRFSSNDKNLFQWLRQLVEWQKNLPDSRQFMDSVRTDLKPIVIYVFTPKGDLYELPIGSTPIDFAYAVHTEVGNHCVGAKINKKLLPLRYQLRSGDMVEIITSPNSTPSKDWLKIVKTSKSKNKIKVWLKNLERRRSVDIGKKVFERELRKHKVSISEVYKKDNLKNVLNELGYKNIEELYINIGFGRTSVTQIVRTIHPNKKLKENLKDKIANRLKVNKGKVVVSGLNDILIHLSKCCSPLPGDEIVGFITRGRGVSIHTRDCLNIDGLGINEERLVDVTWDMRDNTLFQVKVHILTYDQPGVLAEVSTSLHSMKANVLFADVKTSEEKKASLKFLIAVESVNHLEQIFKKLMKIKNVIEVTRFRRS